MARTYQLQDVGLEIFFQQRSSLYLTFSTRQVRSSPEPASFLGLTFHLHPVLHAYMHT